MEREEIMMRWRGWRVKPKRWEWEDNRREMRCWREERGSRLKEKDEKEEGKIKRKDYRGQRGEERGRESAPCVVQHGRLNALQRPSSKLPHHQKSVCVCVCACVCVCVCVCVKPAARCSVRSAALRKATDWHVCNSRTSNPLNTSPFAANVQLLKNYSTFPFFFFFLNTPTAFNGIHDCF